MCAALRCTARSPGVVSCRVVSCLGHVLGLAAVTPDMQAAPLWDSRERRFVGLMTVTDFIDILRHYRYVFFQRGMYKMVSCAYSLRLPACFSCGGAVLLFFMDCYGTIVSCKDLPRDGWPLCFALPVLVTPFAVEAPVDPQTRQLDFRYLFCV